MSAAVATARPSQALRQRRESQRPGLAKPAAKVNTEHSASKEDVQRYVTRQEDVLRKFAGRAPSLRVFLHQNHFRLNDSQETLSYASPMRELLVHLREKTVPYNMIEEFYAMGIPFYDGCLIVEVHNFRNTGIKAKDETNSAADGSGADPFSIHNYNSFITPSPHAPHPALKDAAKVDQTGGLGTSAEAQADRDVDKENMPAPGQPASQKQAPKAKISTIVLFPNTQTHHADMTLLANTPLPDAATIRRNQAAARAAGNPPTPLTAVPPTPTTTLSAGRSPKRQKMILEEHNVHEFESSVLNATCPKLYLEPTRSFEESLALMEAMTHPNNQHSPPTRKTRKRTTAELAADEAEAAEIQRYMLAGDEHQASKTAAASGGDEGQHAVRAGANQQTFSRFKTLAAIKTNHEEAERRKKEEEARQAQAKRQAQIDAEAQKRREMEANHQAEQVAASNALLQKKQEALRQQQQQQQPQALALQQMANATAQASQTPLSATQPQFSSPVVRQQTPMAAAASPLIQTHATHPMGGTPMVATSSNHAAGSPARPPSAISHHPNAMVRSASQQQNQNLSRTGTPQMVQGTPVMNSSMPARNISSTPTPRMNNQGSPNAPVPGATPILMQTPQPGQNMTPEQMQFIQNQQSMQNQLRAQGMQQANTSPSNQQHLQQLAIQRANMHIQTNGVPAGQNPQHYRQMLAQRFYQQAMQQNQQRMAANISPQGMPHAANPNAAGGQLANMTLQQLRQHYTTRKQQLLQNFGNNIPQQHVLQMRQLEQAINAKEAQLQQQAQQQQAMAQANQMPMSQGMPNQINMQAGANAQNSVQMQQYQQMLQQQRAHQQRQNQIMQMRQQAMQQGGGQMNAGMMNNMPAGFNVNMGMNMGMGNMQGMNQGNMGMQGMQAMNMGNIQGGLTQQQMQQMFMMRQAQQRAAMQQGQQQQQQQQQQQGGDMNWSSV